VRAAFFADAERSSAERAAEAAPPILPPFLLDTCDSGLLRPLPDFLPPPDSLFTVAQARRFASFAGVPRSSYPSAMCSALRFCLSVYFDLSPLAISCSSLRLMCLAARPIRPARGGFSVRRRAATSLQFDCKNRARQALA